MKRLVAPVRVFREVLRRITRERAHGLDWPVGRSQWGDSLELILAPASSGVERTLRVVLTDDFDPPRWLPPPCAGVLLVGRERRRGRAVGFLARSPVDLEPLDCVQLIGPGMHRIPLAGSRSLPDLQQDSGDGSPLRRWSRTIGALGPAWRRLVRLRFGLVGAGRTGSVFARLLLRIGVRHLTLIDPDVMERFNLGESDDCLVESDAGRPKVDALADALRALYPRADIRCVHESISHVCSFDAARACDMLVCSADHDSARLATACVALLFCRPLLDVATGIHREAPNRMGASVRLVLPGRCLLCTGGLRVVDAGRALRSAEAERAFHAGRDWRTERAGSLASLNHLAAALGLRMIEDLLLERIRDTTWLQLEYDSSGRVATAYPPLPEIHDTAPCRLCATLAGMGDDGLALVPGLIRSMER